jgi:hypothetical protein
MSRESTNHILELIDQGVLDPKQFLESLLQALSESEVRDNLEYIQRVEGWPEDMRIEEME